MVRGDRSDLAGRSETQFHCYRFDGAEFDESTGQLSLGGVPVAVEPLPLQLLAELLRRADEVLTKEDLFDLLWAGRPTVDNVLANAVSKLRRALGDTAGRRIVTLPRIGYRLSGPVDRHALGAFSGKPMPMEIGQSVPGREGYALERFLGHTPQSLVWLARHMKSRDVKVFKFAQDSDGLAALKAEFANYQAMRRRLGERADVARVVDANFLVPPFYIEFENGGTDLHRWALDGDPLSAMSLTDRLSLFMRIARTVAAAHDVGVLHGALKPHKVLLFGTPAARTVSLIDFGSGGLGGPIGSIGPLGPGGPFQQTQDVARLQDASPQITVSMYCAPELAAGNARTQQTDLYAMGVLLFQLLVADLRRPLDNGWQTELSDQWLLEDLSAAVAPNPADRLTSVAELVKRLSQLELRRAQRWQQDKEAEQCRAAMTHMMLVKRQRPLIAALIAGLVVGLVVSLWYGIRPMDVEASTSRTNAYTGSKK